MNLAAQKLGRLGGLAKSEAKASANRAKAAAFWADVRAGVRAAPKHRKKRRTKKQNPHWIDGLYYIAIVDSRFKDYPDHTTVAFTV